MAASDDLATLVARHQHALTCLAFRLVGNWEDARDLTQWAFTRLWLSRDRLDPAREAFFYLRRILVNLALDHLRRHRHDRDVVWIDPDETAGGVTPAAQLEAQERQALLLRCIAQLKPKQKAALVLRDVEGYSVAETAALLSCSANNVLVNLHLARKNVRRKLQEWLSPHEILSQA